MFISLFKIEMATGISSVSWPCLNALVKATQSMGNSKHDHVHKTHASQRCMCEINLPPMCWMPLAQLHTRVLITCLGNLTVMVLMSDQPLPRVILVQCVFIALLSSFFYLLPPSILLV